VVRTQKSGIKYKKPIAILRFARTDLQHCVGGKIRMLNMG
jgi:hypothetical protein